MTEPDTADPVPPAPETPPVPWRWTDALLAFLLAMAVVIVATPLVLLTGASTQSPLMLFVGAAATIAGVLFVTRRRHGPDAVRLLWGHRRAGLRDVLIGVGAAVVALVAVNIIVVLLTLGGQPPQVQTELRDAVRVPSLLPVVALAAVVLVPVAEELLYRGMLFQGLRGQLGRWPAIGLSSLVFGLLHYQDSLSGTLLLLAAFYPLGMWLAWLFDRRGTLVVPIVVHMTYNGLNLGLLVSGRG